MCYFEEYLSNDLKQNDNDNKDNKKLKMEVSSDFGDIDDYIFKDENIKYHSEK